MDGTRAWLRTVTDEPFAYLTTTGRVTGEPHEIEIWYGADDTTVYFLSGGRDRADWVRNLRREPRVTVRIADRTVAGVARVVAAGDPEDATARRLVWRRYTTDERDLVHWRDSALPVAVDLEPGDHQPTPRPSS
jgi:deazaflavin-dependent oxidoreductase (nitroreductase family)